MGKNSNGRSLLIWFKLPTKFIAIAAPDVVVATPTALLSFMKTSDRIREKRWFNRDLFISGITHLIIDEVDLSLLGLEKEKWLGSSRVLKTVAKKCVKDFLKSYGLNSEKETFETSIYIPRQYVFVGATIPDTGKNGVM